MGSLFFLVAAVALASALPGAALAWAAARDGGWSATGDGVLFWLTWAGDLGHRRLLAAAALAVFVLAAARALRSRAGALPALFRGAVAMMSTPWAALVSIALAALPLAVTPLVRPDPGQRPDVIVVLLDTVRLDYVGWGGSELDTTPRLDALAARGTSFTQAITQAPWTKPSTATLLTGLMPNQHLATTRYTPVPAAVRTLPEAYAAAGYRTAGYSSNPNITGPFGFQQGFLEWRWDVGADAESLLADARAWLDTDSDRPSFLYLHLNDAHYPYTPHESVRGMFNQTGVEAHLDGPSEHLFRRELGATMSAEQVESLRLSYAEEIRWLDGVVGAFLEERLESGRDTLVVVCADHGEEFLEHGDLGHGHTVYEELLRVPLQFAWSEDFGRANSFQPGTWNEQVRLLDVAPTLLAASGMRWPVQATPLGGRTLTQFLVGAGDLPRPAASETDSIGSPLSGPPGPLRAFRDGAGNKLILTDPWMIPAFAGRYWLFDLYQDPSETRNLAGDRPEERQRLLDAFLARGWLTERMFDFSGGVEISAEHKAQLAEMGYAEDEDPEAFLEKEPYLDPKAVPWWPWQPTAGSGD